MNSVGFLNASLRDRFTVWLRQPDNVHRRWLGNANVFVAWTGLVVAVLSPPHGFGITVCLLKATTGIPCLGCGLTRSLSCGVRGMFHESLQYHPFGLFILALFAVAAGTSLLPKSRQERLVQYMERRAAFFNTLYLMFVLSFVSFGLVRAVLHIAHTL